MYYFIFEYPRNRKLVEVARQVEDEVVSCGIAGEIIELTPARNIDNLIADAGRKGYQTLVVVGGSKLVNKIASKLLRYEMVFGVVPLGRSESLEKLINCSDWKEAVDALKRRRWIFSAMGRIEDKTTFISPCNLDIQSKKRVTIETDNWSTQINTTSLTVQPINKENGKPLIAVHCQSKVGEKSGLASWWHTLTSTEKTALSVFKNDSIIIKTEEQLSLVIDDMIIARTPTTISVIPRAIRLIVAKKSV